MRSEDVLTQGPRSRIRFLASMERLHEATKILKLKSTLSASELQSPASTTSTSTGASTPSEFPLDGTPTAQEETQLSWADLEEDGWSDAEPASPSGPSRSGRRRTRQRRRVRGAKELPSHGLRVSSQKEASQLESDRRDRAVVTWTDLGLGLDRGNASKTAEAARTRQANIMAALPSWTLGATSTPGRVANDASGRLMQTSYCLSPGIATTPFVTAPDISPQAAVHAFMIPVLQSTGMQPSVHLEATLKATAPDVYED